MKIGFIGGGKLAYALASGFISAGSISFEIFLKRAFNLYKDVINSKYVLPGYRTFLHSNSKLSKFYLGLALAFVLYFTKQK